jgi:hypothetical protein
VQVKADGGKAIQVFQLSNGCATLPISLGSFTATRNKNVVSVKWQTLSEQSTSGFNVQRKTDGGWVNVGYIASRSNGNSSTPLKYELADLNAFKGMTQYQLVVVSSDGSQKLSEIKSVRGEAQVSKVLLYPNPSSNGRVNLVFDNNSPKDILINDMTGRVVQQIKGTTQSQVTVANLHAGFYNVQIIDRATADSVTEKLIIQK